ncbi:MAG: calcium/sodium antiporter [Kofleriaceae bacterium]
MLDVGSIVLGLVLLYFGAGWLVGGAAGLASSFGLRPLIVGLTVVAYGTSSPELVVGIGAALGDQGAIALGNVVGSNIANLGLILGVSALIRPAPVDRALRLRELPVLVLATALVPVTLLDGEISRLEAAALLGLAIGYTTLMVLGARRGGAEVAAEVASEAAAATAIPPPRRRSVLALLVVVGMALLIVGGELLVGGAVGVARKAGMSDRLIGLTIIAVGTSVPELATSIIAAVRGHGAIAVGNVIGSNIFNVLLILGASGATRALAADPSALLLDLASLGGFTVVGVAMMITGSRVSRAEGGLLLAGYVTFLVAVIVR